MYGIIAAMQEEMQEIKKIMVEIEEKKVYELTFFEGKINNKTKTHKKNCTGWCYQPVLKVFFLKFFSEIFEKKN